MSLGGLVLGAVDSYTLYLDGSGDPGFPPPWGKSRSKHYILAGVALTPLQDHSVHTQVFGLLEKHFGKDYFGTTELHYSDVIGGYGLFKGMPELERKEIADSVFTTLLGIKPVLFATVIEKGRLKTKYGRWAENPTSLAVRATADRFDKFIQRNGAIGGLHMDEEEIRKDGNLRGIIHRARTSGIKLSVWKNDSKLSRFLNAIAFSPSQTSPGIQLADFVSHTCWMHFTYGKSDRFTQIAPLWDRTGGRVWEPSVVPR